ncbi:deoxyribose-phosphate aldolase [Acetivibrio sp. MSJd-27]|jgi:deoxyribose-phosphate aldolase|uniref:deoxyribose-phosphate aldolase n=1 Tax=Acetivibrio sp. MSJd-27 TaxID=2841523 RepID=UPI0015AF8F38|nr:deoxyribose-phosphate aldolase [Acetivibrio sp. MSJd-27]MBU5449472.1 deoxyribose-phosphate aldolase [Acetivibrio sp. MSJd-27]
MEINKIIDHTILKPDATKEEVQRVCAEAKQYRFASVCVNSCYTRLVHEALTGTEVKTCTVVGFPLGATSVKPLEASRAVWDGADEIDMVINLGALKQKEYQAVRLDIESVVEASEHALVKVIIETCLLTDDEKKRACELAVLAGADFVKTSTGFSTGGAATADVALMRKTVGADIGVKASGGIRTLEDVLKMTGAGANRIGTSSGVQIIAQTQKTE